jgi:ATP-dependent RNA helicase MSS116
LPPSLLCLLSTLGPLTSCSPPPPPPFVLPS